MFICNEMYQIIESQNNKYNTRLIVTDLFEKKIVAWNLNATYMFDLYLLTYLLAV